MKESKINILRREASALVTITNPVGYKGDLTIEVPGGTPSFDTVTREGGIMRGHNPNTPIRPILREPFEFHKRDGVVAEGTDTLISVSGVQIWGKLVSSTVCPLSG